MKRKFAPSSPAHAKKYLRLITCFLLIGILISAAACRNGTNNGTETQPNTEGDTAPMEIPTDFSLLSYGGFALNGKDLTANYTAEDATFDFSKRIAVKFGATWTLSTDEAGANVIDSKSVTLNGGENRYYVTVKFRGETFTYSALINYRSAYTVQFYTGTNASYAETQTVDKGATVNKPADPTREGYTFQGWYLNGEAFDFSTPPTEDTLLIAHWDKIDKTFQKPSTAAPTFEGISGSLHVVWKDYADCNLLRPTEVICVLTQSYGSEKKEYEIVLKRDSATWKNPVHAPGGAMLTQGDGGAWTLSISNLPATVGSDACSYKLVQKPLDGNYTTQQVGTEAVNTVKGYVASVDHTAKLTTYNGRLYDAAGNMTVLKGVVTLNVGRKGADTSLSPEALEKLKAIGCNGLRLTAQLIGTSDAAGDGYVYLSNGNSRTDAYNDSNATRISETGKQNMLNQIYDLVDKATEAGLYIVIDWGILTSNPYQYINEASEFFGILSAKYADNPYVLYEICNEPKSTWGTQNGKTNSVKAYGEAIISVIRANDSDAVVILAPNESATRLSDLNGDDPINDPLGDDIAYNVAYTFHCYPYNYSYDKTQFTYGWRLRDAYNAGLTVVVTEFSPMDGTFDSPDTLSYDMEEAAKYLRLFQEWDVSFFYFRYESPVSTNQDYYHENSMFAANLNLTIRQWTVDDMTGCGRWYYEILTGDGMFTDVDYDTARKKDYRKNFDNLHAAYGLGTTFPGFATDCEIDGNTCFYRVGELEDLSDVQYKAYAVLLWERIERVAANGVIKTPSGATFTKDMLPKTIYESMELTYEYGAKTVNFSLTYGLNASGSAYGVILTVK